MVNVTNKTGWNCVYLDGEAVINVINMGTKHIGRNLDLSYLSLL